MNCETLLELIDRGEDSKIQFKVNFSHINALAAEIAAFSNSDGGHILVGVENGGNIKGLSKEDVKHLNQWISNACSQKILPPVQVFTENIICDGKRVLVINVLRGINKPYVVNKTEYWIKIGSDKRRASREELIRLFQASGSLYADELPVLNSTINDIKLHAFNEFCKEYYRNDYYAVTLTQETLLRNLKLLTNHNVSLAGLLFFGHNPQQFKSQFMIKAVAYAGNEIGGTKYLDSEDILGTIPNQFKDAMGFLKRNLKKTQKEQDFNSIGIIEIPEIALQEIIVNALIHRDYFINSTVRIFIFDDRVEIISPGKLPDQVSIENIKEGIQIARNPLLLSLTSKFATIGKIPYRGIGSGILRTIQECREAHIAEPIFEENKTPEFFKVTLLRNN